MIEVTWKTKDGRDVVATLEIVEETVNDGWGNEIGTGRYKIDVTIKLDGVTQHGYLAAEQLPEAYRAAGIKYAVGCLAVSEENAARIAEAYEELEADHRIVEMRRRAEAAIKEIDAYECHHAAIVAAMEEGSE